MKMRARSIANFLLAMGIALAGASFSPIGFGQDAREIVVLENEHLRVKINPIGAELQSIINLSTSTEILWIGDSTYWQAQAPVMFPVNVRFKDEKYSYRGKEYEMPRMGLAAINRFEVVPEGDSHKAMFAFSHTPQTKASYPFDFDLKITYELSENQLINHFSISNLGMDTMFFALGGHPGFNCPLENGLTRADYEYVFPHKMTIDRTAVENSLVQESKIPYLVNEDRLSLQDERVPNGGMFLPGHKLKEIGVARKGERPFVKVNLMDFPNVNLWSPPGMPFACIEPMVSHHDVEESPSAIKEKSHLVNLIPGETRQYRFAIIVPR